MASLLEQLNIEPGALLVNIVGFMVLLWLVKRYAMGPISEFMRERSEKIQKKIEDADTMRAAAASERDNLQDELDQMRAQMEEQMERDRRRAAEDIEQMQTEAQRQREQIIESGEAELQRAREEMMGEIKQIATEMAVEVSEKVLRGALDDERQAQLTQSVIDDVNRLADEETSG
ncbi:MAG: F0F1 ATP synthase subunit B [Armatimonadota bacterium]